MLTIFRNNKFGYLKSVNSKSDPKVAQRIVKDMRGKMDDVSVVGAALVALYNLGSNIGYQTRLFDYGVIEMIVVAMRTHSTHEKLLHTACASIVNCCGNIYGSIRSGAADEVLRCMDVFRKNVELQTSACLALKALSRSPYGAWYIMMAEGNRLLVRVLNDFPDDATLLSAAFSAISSICSHAKVETNTSFATDTGPESGHASFALESLWKVKIGNNIISSLKHPAAQTDEKLARNLISSVWTVGRPMSMLRLGSALYVVKIMKAFPRDRTIVATSLSILSSYAESGKNGQILITVGAAKAIIDALKQPDFENDLTLQQKGFLALCNLSFYDLNKRALIDSGVSKLTFQAFTTYAEYPQIIELVVAINANLATLEPFAKRLLKKKIHQTVVDAAKMHKKSEELVMHSVNLFRNLSFFDELRVLPLTGTIPLIKKATKRFPNNDTIKNSGTEAIEKMEENRI